ncbi:flagellar biosynthesis anti-sigma factor FlgM [Clostridium algoriphilum]|uniref:flagellar biosynthesis anti-sigma factor FlgM n=1 Tax=Clostridium algoriphilum TaxID=198347 RepID=UPI001CF45E9A|nr:flagellar biosynthesis anti-sigma factor FlgM [Clostridium algoriphilum]MCB2294278.1 flagellar biosynthesis anti-sigma factor FlgM [Clostridium algoriphilum]
MKIDGVKHNVIMYKKNTVKIEPKVNAVKKDTVELSREGKKLSELSLNDNSVNSKEKIEAIKNKVLQGTYKVDSKLTAKRIIDIMKGRDV